MRHQDISSGPWIRDMNLDRGGLEHRYLSTGAVQLRSATTGESLTLTEREWAAHLATVRAGAEGAP